MLSAIQQFRINLTRVRDLGNLAQALSSLTTTAVDFSDIWRAQMVLGVSALDHFTHEMARLGMIESAKGARQKTDAYRKFPLPLIAAEQGISGQVHEAWLGDAIREKHSFLTFQQPDKIADAIRLISPVKLWDEVALELAMSSKDVKIHLELIVERRNKIAHEADMDPANPGFRWPITSILAVDSLDFISRVAEAIFKVVA